MFTNKTKNSNTNHLNTDLITSNYSRPRLSLPINIPRIINRLYIHNPLRNEERFINIDLNSTYPNSMESESDPTYATIESPPQKVGSSTFYIDTESMETESETSEAASPLFSENDDESIYETIAPRLPFLQEIDCEVSMSLRIKFNLTIIPVIPLLTKKRFLLKYLQKQVIYF